MKQFVWFLVRLALLAAVMALLPIAGVVARGDPADRYLHFPPTTAFVDQPAFSWWFAAPLIALCAAIAGFFAFRFRSAAAARDLDETRREFPWWGWPGAVLTVAAWAVAWTRFDVFEPVQKHTFTPLWLGYVVVVSALTQFRSGRCLMTSRPRLFLGSFPLSALFWWAFEYFNRFVANWAYAGAGDLSPLEYFLLATPPFATVIPAVLVTTELVATFPRLASALAGPVPTIAPSFRTPVGGALLASAGGGLLLLGVYPDYLFPLVWVAPLVLVQGAVLLAGRDLALLPHTTPRWPVWAPCLAALCCGFFWEMWNFGSLAHWEYSVPFVQKWLIFEMPVLGYSGYVPFGLECTAVAALLPGWERNAGPGPLAARDVAAARAG